MSEAIFTSQLKNKEKIDRRCWQQRASHSKISNAYLAKNQWAKFDKVVPFQNIKCLRLWNGQGLPSVRTLTWHLVLNKPAVLFVQFHQNQPNSRVACMISPLYVATPWTYRHLLSCGGNEWFDVFMNILCSSHWNQAEHPCLHKYKKVISIKQTVLWIDSFNRHIHGPCRAHF